MDRKHYGDTVYNQIVLSVTSCNETRHKVDRLLTRIKDVGKHPTEIHGRVQELRLILKSCCDSDIVDSCILTNDTQLLQWTAEYVWGEIILEIGAVSNVFAVVNAQDALLDLIYAHKKTKGEKQKEENPDYAYQGKMYTFDSVRKAKRGDIYRFDKSKSLNKAACTHAMERPVYKLKETAKDTSPQIMAILLGESMYNPCAEIPLKDSSPCDTEYLETLKEKETLTMLQRSDKKTGPVCYIRGYEQTSLAADLPFTYAILKEVSEELAQLVKLPGQELGYIIKQREVLENDIKKLSILLN